MAKRSYELTEAISALIQRHPFFAVLLLDLLEIVETDSIPTAATNSVQLLVNPTFFAKQLKSVDERMFVLAHEIAHVIMQHPERMRLYMDRGVGPDLKEFDTKKWNHAGDYIINSYLEELKVGKMPIGSLHNPNISKADLLDDVYQQLPDDPNKNGGGQGWDTHVPSDPNAGPSKAQVQRAVKSAAAAAKSRGNLPAGLQRLVDEICEPQVHWQDYLRKSIMSLAGKDQSTWVRPNRRKLAVAPHVYWPGRCGALTGPVVVEIDTSGSISERELSVFMGELAGILTDAPPEKLTVMFVDAECHGIHEVDDVQDLTRLKGEAKGGGGTDMTVVFKKLEEEGIDAATVIVLTDGYTPFGDEAGKPNTIWCITTDVKAPWGETVHVTIPQQ